MKRKTIDVDEASITSIAVKKRLMNDIMFYLRKLMKLVRQAQRVSLFEGVECETEKQEIQEELAQVRREIIHLEHQFDKLS